MALPTSQLEALANDILTETFQNSGNISLPVDLGRIASKNGLSVELGLFQDPNVSGAYSKPDKKIFVSADDSYQRQAFTTAHELGHYFLHQDHQQDVMLRQYSLDPGSQTGPREVEASKFAAALLMPRDMIADYWNMRMNISDIAQIFGVSQSAASWRLHNLGLLDS